MILVDTAIGSKELKSLIIGNGVKCDAVPLQFGDAAFEGNGDDGTIGIGVERKRLHDMLNCIDDSRYSAHQRVGMAKMYRKSILMLEGHWKAREDGILMEGFDGGTKWTPCKYRSQSVMYSKLYRYLLSIALSGVIITYTRDINHTAFNICEIFHYFQKQWRNHTSLLEVQKLNIPALSGKPTLTRRWASDLEGVGVKFSIEAERMFKTPINLAHSDETEWLRIPGIGVRTAQDIVKEINGWK